jgi:hypothetical protein
MDSGPKGQSRSPFTTTWGNYQSLTSPTNSADEAKIREFLAGDHRESRGGADSAARREVARGSAPGSRREVARRSRGTPRLAIRLLERARDLAQLAAAPIISVDHVDQAAQRLGIEERGLDRVDGRGRGGERAPDGGACGPLTSPGGKPKAAARSEPSGTRRSVAPPGRRCRRNLEPRRRRRRWGGHCARPGEWRGEHPSRRLASSSARCDVAQLAAAPIMPVDHVGHA